MMRALRGARRDAQRGAAVVELAITSVAFVTTLLFGIYFGELGFMMLKVQEAAHSAMLDSTSRRVHRLDLVAVNSGFESAYKPFANKMTGHAHAADRAEKKYGDFDGVNSNGSGFTQVMASGDNMKVSCVPTASLNGSDPLSFGIPTKVSSKRPHFFGAVRQYMSNMYRDRGGVSCSASATVQAINFPTAFMEGDGPLAQQKLFKSQPLRICGLGLAKNGKCTGQLAVLTGDWAIDGELNSVANRDMLQLSTGLMEPGGNLAYRKIIKDLFEANGDGGQKKGAGRTAAQNLMIVAGGFSVADVMDENGEYNERRFLMSDSGAESHYEQELLANDPGQRRDVWYNTSGVDLGSTSKNPNKRGPKQMKYARCFLGIGSKSCRPPPKN